MRQSENRRARGRRATAPGPAAGRGGRDPDGGQILRPAAAAADATEPGQRCLTSASAISSLRRRVCPPRRPGDRDRRRVAKPPPSQARAVTLAVTARPGPGAAKLSSPAERGLPGIIVTSTRRPARAPGAWADLDASARRRGGDLARSPGGRRLGRGRPGGPPGSGPGRGRGTAAERAAAGGSAAAAAAGAVGVARK